MTGSLAVRAERSHRREASGILQPACSTGWHHRRMRHGFDAALEAVNDWDVEHAAVAVVGPDGIHASIGDGTRGFAWASVTKLVTAYAVLRAVEQGSISLDDPLGPPEATVRHLLAHASGLGPESMAPISRPARTRIYSNAGFDLLGELLAERGNASLGRVLELEILGPLGMIGTRLIGRASAGLWGPVDDIARLGQELLRPSLVGTATLDRATIVAFPGLAGVLPGIGRFDPLDWGLGFELRGTKQPHWTGTANSPATFGHFGASGTFLWVDPVARIALACATDRHFGPWALEAWPQLSDAVLAAAVQTS
jgi:CubicO group peptidase (beta-lactamase class C family)